MALLNILCFIGCCLDIFFGRFRRIFDNILRSPSRRAFNYVFNSRQICAACRRFRLFYLGIRLNTLIISRLCRCRRFRNNFGRLAALVTAFIGDFTRLFRFRLCNRIGRNGIVSFRLRRKLFFKACRFGIAFENAQLCIQKLNYLCLINLNLSLYILIAILFFRNLLFRTADNRLCRKLSISYYLLRLAVGVLFYLVRRFSGNIERVTQSIFHRFILTDRIGQSSRFFFQPAIRLVYLGIAVAYFL